MTDRSEEDRTDPGATALRDLRCGELRAEDAGRRVTLAGWVHRRRDLGGLFFVDMRDRAGVAQVSLGPEWSSEEALELGRELNPEDVIRVTGEVVRRPDDAVNPELPTGEVEVHAEEVERLSEAASLPILVAVPPEEDLPSEELRLRHRVLDLRRPEMLENFRVRHRATAAARRALDAEDFLEVETPLLTRRTPEGARDFLVPSRMHRGEFYSLPQSPQLYKQLLMVSGFDRYYQVAKCLRDEDLRADRQPEFTQIDAEMAFVGEEDVQRVCSRMLARMWEEGAGVSPELPFPKISYDDAVERYGTDSPDLRVPWELQDFSDALTGIGFRIFDGAVKAGGRVRGFVAGTADGSDSASGKLSRADLDELDELAQDRGAKGVLWLAAEDDGWSGPPARFLEDHPEAAETLRAEHGVEEGDVVLLVAGTDAETGGPLSALRREAARRLDALEEDAHRFAWIVEYPLFEEDPETGEPVPSHHPFTLPRSDDPERVVEEPLSAKSHAYDVVYNGTEICSGSIRCHDSALQRAIFTVLGLSSEEAEQRFGFLLEAFRFGVPPHGGFAVGLDRVIALMVGADSIREVIAFPKTTAARALMEGAPSAVDEAELTDLGLEIRRGGSGPGE